MSFRESGGMSVQEKFCKFSFLRYLSLVVYEKKKEETAQILQVHLVFLFTMTADEMVAYVIDILCLAMCSCIR